MAGHVQMQINSRKTRAERECGTSPATAPLLHFTAGAYCCPCHLQHVRQAGAGWPAGRQLVPDVRTRLSSHCLLPHFAPHPCSMRGKQVLAKHLGEDGFKVGQ